MCRAPAGPRWPSRYCRSSLALNLRQLIEETLPLTRGGRARGKQNVAHGARLVLIDRSHRVLVHVVHEQHRHTHPAVNAGLAPVLPVVEPFEVDTVLKAELNVAMVQLEGAGALAEIIAVLTDRTLGGLLGASPVGVEVAVMRVRLARKMFRVVNRI